MTTGAQFLLSWWFRKQPIFWLPEGWVPYPVAWLLSFPSAPIGKHNQAQRGIFQLLWLILFILRLCKLWCLGCYL